MRNAKPRPETHFQRTKTKKPVRNARSPFAVLQSMREWCEFSNQIRIFLRVLNDAHRTTTAADTFQMKKLCLGPNLNDVLDISPNLTSPAKLFSARECAGSPAGQKLAWPTHRDPHERGPPPLTSIWPAPCPYMATRALCPSAWPAFVTTDYYAPECGRD